MPHIENLKIILSLFQRDGIYDKHKAISAFENLINFVNIEENIQIEKNRLDNEYKLVKSTLKDDFNGSNTQLKLIKELQKLFVFGASDKQLLINKNFNELKKIKKQLC